MSAHGRLSLLMIRVRVSVTQVVDTVSPSTGRRSRVTGPHRRGGRRLPTPPLRWSTAGRSGRGGQGPRLRRWWCRSYWALREGSDDLVGGGLGGRLRFEQAVHRSGPDLAGRGAVHGVTGGAAGPHHRVRGDPGEQRHPLVPLDDLPQQGPRGGRAAHRAAVAAHGVRLLRRVVDGDPGP